MRRRYPRACAVTLAPKSDSYASWGERLHAYAATSELADELPFWLECGAGASLPCDDDHGGVDLVGDGEEVSLVLDAETSIADRCIDVLGGVALAHLACHGAFRSDNPLFSSLRVADGDLTVYDLERCRRLASVLASTGVTPGDTVAVLAPNIPEMLEAHYGVPMAGAVLLTVNIRLDAPAVAFILRHSGARALLDCSASSMRQ